MVNPYVLIATHQRLSITKENVKSILSCGVGVVLVVSDADEFKVFKQLFPDISIIHHANYPLGLKWQAGVEAARALRADPLIINGSDDLLCQEYFTRVSELLNEGHHFIGLKSWYVYDDDKSKNLYKFDYLAPIPLGGGRAYSRELLEKINYKVFDVRKEKHLDDLGFYNVQRTGLKTILLQEPLILSVKGNWRVMNPLNAMFGSKNAILTESIYHPEEILKGFNYGNSADSKHSAA